jgi:outer membrane protein TolC
MFALTGALISQNDSQTLVLSETSTKTESRPGREMTLKDLIDEALANNLRIRIDEARIGEARALLSLAAAQAYPRFDANLLAGGPLPERKTRVVNDVNTLTQASYLGQPFNWGELGFTVHFDVNGVQPIYTFGKISSAKEAAGFAVKAATEKRVVTQAEVVMDVHRAFWAVQLTRSYVSSLRDGEKTLQKVLKKIEELLDAESPQVTENDRLRLVYAAATVRVRAKEAESASIIALGALKLLVGREQTVPMEVVTVDLDELPGKIPDLDQYVRVAREDRPEILALRAVVNASDKFALFRKNRLWPDIYLGGILSYAYTSNATDQTNPFIYDPYNYFTLGVGVGLRYELDVFNKVAELEQAEAATATHVQEEATVEQAVDFEVRKLHQDLTSGYERIPLLERANRAARGWLTASTLAYDIGTGDARELIDSFLAWAASEAELQKTRYDMHLAHADLSRAAGQLMPRLK